MSVCHPMYWDFWPILDHVIPLARGGKDHDDNLVTTSALRNSAKLNWTLEELGWKLLPGGDMHHWDGLMGWFMEYVEADQSVLVKKQLRAWHAAALKNSF